MVIESNSPNNMETSPKKKVLFVITQSEFGGAQRFLHTLVTRLDKNKFEILVVAGPASGIRNQELLDQLEKDGVKAKRLKYLQREIHPTSDLLALFELKRVIKEFSPDTLFLLSSKAGFVGSFVSKFLIRNSKFKILYRIGGWTFNDPWPKWKKWLWIVLERLSAKWKDVVIVNNRHDLEQAHNLKVKPREKVVLIHNGLDVYKMDLLPRNEARKKLWDLLPKWTSDVYWTSDIVNTIGTIANFYPTKGLKYFMETAEHFKNRDDVVFVVIGDGQERNKLENLIEQKGLQRKVFLMGQVPEAHKLLSAFNIFVLPSVKEGFPWVVLEAMAAKLPVIATNVGAVPEIIEDGQNGFIVEPSRPEQIAGKIQELLNNEHLRQELGIQAHQTVLFKFPLEKMVKEIEKLLDRPSA